VKWSCFIYSNHSFLISAAGTGQSHPPPDIPTLLEWDLLAGGVSYSATTQGRARNSAKQSSFSALHILGEVRYFTLESAIPPLSMRATRSTIPPVSVGNPLIYNYLVGLHQPEYTIPPLSGGVCYFDTTYQGWSPYRRCKGESATAVHSVCCCFTYSSARPTWATALFFYRKSIKFKTNSWIDVLKKTFRVYGQYVQYLPMLHTYLVQSIQLWLTNPTSSTWPGISGPIAISLVGVIQYTGDQSSRT
jgi:hypothetical protein